MCLAVAFVGRVVILAGTLTHNALADDERRTFLFLLGGFDGLANLLAIVTVDLDDVPTPCTILHGRIFSHDVLGLCRELDVVRVVEHDEIVQTQMAGDASAALRDFLLYATVRDVCVDGLLGERRIAGAGSQELGGNGSTYGKGVALSQRTGSVLDTAFDVNLGVSGCRRTPLTQLLQFVQRELAGQC